MATDDPLAWALHPWVDIQAGLATTHLVQAAILQALVDMVDRLEHSQVDSHRDHLALEASEHQAILKTTDMAELVSPTSGVKQDLAVRTTAEWVHPWTEVAQHPRAPSQCLRCRNRKWRSQGSRT